MKITVEEIKRVSENLLGFITVYVLRVQRCETSPAYRIYRRYHEIHGLHEHLKLIFHTSVTGVRFPPFPTRKLLFLTDRSFQRKAKDLSLYFDGLLDLSFVVNSSTLDEFILKVPKDEERLQILIEQNPDFRPRLSFSGPLKINGIFVEAEEDAEQNEEEFEGLPVEKTGLEDHTGSSEEKGMTKTDSFAFLNGNDDMHSYYNNMNNNNNNKTDEEKVQLKSILKAPSHDNVRNRINDGQLTREVQFELHQRLHNELHDKMNEIRQDWTESILNEDWFPDRPDCNLLHSVQKGQTVHVIERTNAGWWLVTDPQYPGFFGYLPAAYLSIPINELESISCSEPWSVRTDYLKSQDDELSVVYGDTVTVIEKFVDGWWRCQTEDNQIGMVPYSVLMRPNKSASFPVAMGQRGIRGQSLRVKVRPNHG